MTDTTLPPGLTPRARLFAIAAIAAIFVLGALASRRPSSADTKVPSAAGVPAAFRAPSANP